MPDAFDPYHTWLGIPPDEQPPDHYRLLGAPRFEKSLDTIRHAAGRRLAHLRSVQQGEHGRLARGLLREVADARACLLAPEEKAAYDRRLAHSLEAPPPVKPPPVIRESAPRAGQAARQADTETYCLGTLGEYQLLEKLGQGGMGAVYRAMHTKLRREVALKVLSEGRLKDDRAIARFEREMAAVGAVDHPNVVRAYDARQIDETQLLVMELVDGLDLAELATRTGPLPVADACELVRQAALGLQAAHENGLVHRDVKPSNLMLTPQGQVKVLDLGLARFQYDQPPGDELTTGGHVFGTVPYMAPEQATDTHTADIRADIYSLGCTLYKLLAGQAPFGPPKYTSHVEVLTGHARDSATPIAQIRGDTPEDLSQILDRMLAKRPQQRFSTPMEIVDAIGSLTSGADLPSLLARAEGRQAPAAAPSQALDVTQNPQSSTSSALTRFFNQVRGQQTEATAAGALMRSRARRKTPTYVMGAVVLLAAVAATAGVLAWNSWRSDRGGGPAVASHSDSESRENGARHDWPKPPAGDPNGPTLTPRTELVLRWPEVDRTNAKIEIDGQVVDLSDATIQSTAEEITVRLPGGQHELWIARRGFQPFQRQVALAGGQSLVVTPQWTQTPPQPEVGDTTTTPPASDGPGGDPTEDPSPEENAADDEAQRRLAEFEASEARWMETTKEAEELAAAWEFAGASEALRAVEFAEEELNARAVLRREELGRLAQFKTRIVNALNGADPPLAKSDLALRGQGGQLLSADEEAVTAKTTAGQMETHRWDELSAESVSKLVLFAVDPENGEDRVTAGLLALVAADPRFAEECLDEAAERGVDVGPYQSTLAIAAFRRVRQLLAEGMFQEAETALDDMRRRYGRIPWFTVHTPLVDAARDQVEQGIFEEEAKTLYTEALGLFEKQQLFELKPLVEKLGAEYAASRVVAGAEAGRSPSVEELAKAVENLGSLLTVRLDGEGDFTKVQAAIDAAPANSLIEIQDNGPYDERIRLPWEKGNLTLRGGKDCRPVIASTGPITNTAPLVEVLAPHVVLERLSLLYLVNPVGNTVCVLQRKNCSLSVRSCVLYAPNEDDSGVFSSAGATPTDTSEFDACVIIGQGYSASYSWSRLVVANSIWLGKPKYVRGGFHFENVLLPTSGFGAWSSGELHGCTIAENVGVGQHDVVIDCIMPSVSSKQAGARIEFCNVHGPVPFVDVAKPGECSFSGNPRFVNPLALDYRLGPGSPCLGTASDGGAVGVRYTPEMIEILAVAFDLRAVGAIKFSTKSK